MPLSFLLRIALSFVVIGGIAKAESPAQVVSPAQIVGSPVEVRVHRAGENLLLSVNDVARAFGWQPKLVTPGKLLTLCAEGADSACIPFRLETLANSGTEDDLFLEAAALGRALRFTTHMAGDRITLQPARTNGSHGGVPAYHADWGESRGFEVGQTVPDIPLYDLDGREVRFSRFLGQQYILYCWSSWCSCRATLPEWEQKFQKYRSRGFTIVGVALDAEGAAPPKLYYEKYGVTFPALIDPNFATRIEAAPMTFFVDEHGVVQPLENWEQRIKAPEELRPVTRQIRRQWTKSGRRVEPAAMAELVARYRAAPNNLAAAAELASRYLDLQLASEARHVLETAVSNYDARAVANSGDPATTRLLAQAYFQLARASDNREAAVRCATLSYYLNPFIGLGKQIARMIAPDKFDGRPDGNFDSQFRQATLDRLARDRELWLKGKTAR